MLDQRLDVVVTVTMRVNEPYDRIGTDLLLKASLGMEAWVDRIIVAVQRDAQNYVVARAADAALDAAIAQFILGLRYLDDEAPVLVGGSWFHAEPSAQEAGIKAIVRFGGARRMQAFDVMT